MPSKLALLLPLVTALGPPTMDTAASKPCQELRNRAGLMASRDACHAAALGGTASPTDHAGLMLVDLQHALPRRARRTASCHAAACLVLQHGWTIPHRRDALATAWPAACLCRRQWRCRPFPGPGIMRVVASMLLLPCDRSLVVMSTSQAARLRAAAQLAPEHLHVPAG